MLRERSAGHISKLATTRLERGENQERAAVISCVFGNSFRSVYFAPQQFSSYFYSNNPNLETQARHKGWKFRYVDLPLSEDNAVSSFQSKYVKYLQVRKASDHTYLNQYNEILYVDHKFMITDWHVRQFLNIKQRPVLIRKTPRLKVSVWDEVQEAGLQERYRRYMNETLEYVRRQIAGGCSDQIRVCNTGLICYSMQNACALELADTVYADLCAVGTPECQIIWCMASQKYSHLIQQIEFNQIPLLWKLPKLADSIVWQLLHPRVALSRLFPRSA
jgi:hypothetical protein